MGTLHELYADPGAMRFAGGATQSLDESEERLRRFLDHQERHGFGFWAVTLRENAAVIGDGGLIHLAFRGPEVEVGYRLKSPYWGKGYATEVARAVVAYGFDTLGLDRIVGVTHPENVASQRVLEKAGLRFEGMSVYKGKRVRKYAIERVSR
ncbi:MAG: GNAT family N-acetyltransferase [Actinomycetota bacterium]|nr:GNAT family N-acetyltransferase [Actinomycetota bacterium]